MTNLYLKCTYLEDVNTGRVYEIYCAEGEGITMGRTERSSLDALLMNLMLNMKVEEPRKKEPFFYSMEKISRDEQKKVRTVLDIYAKANKMQLKLKRLKKKAKFKTID